MLIIYILSLFRPYLVSYCFGVFLVQVDLWQTEFLPSLSLFHPVCEPVLALIDGLLAECHRDSMIILKWSKLGF